MKRFLFAPKYAFKCKHEYDTKLWRHKERTPNTNDHHTPLHETPHTWKVSAYATGWSGFAIFKKNVLSARFLLPKSSYAYQPTRLRLT